MINMLVFIISVDIAVLAGVFASFFVENEIRAYIVLGILCLTFISYHVVSFYLVWQDKIPSRVRRIRFLYRFIYQKEPCGGAMHIVLDDWNVEDEYIYWCLGRLDFLESKGELDPDMKSKYKEIADLLLTFDEFDRLRLLRDCDLIYKEEGSQ